LSSAQIFVEGYQDRVVVISGKVLFEFLPGRRLYTITFSDQTHVLDHAHVAVRSGSRMMDSSSYPEVRWRVVDLSDKLGEGKAFVAFFSSKRELPALTAEFSFYEGRDIVAVAVQVDNTTGHPLVLDELNPISCREKGGKLAFGEASSCKVLRGNWATLDHQPHLFSLGPGVSVDAPHSLLLYDSKGGAALACGILDPAKCLTSFHVSHKPGEDGAVTFHAQQRPVAGGAGGGDTRGLTIPDGRSFSTGRIALVFAKDPHRALEDYAKSVGTVNNIPRLQHIPCGWVSRAHHAGEGTEEQVLSHAAFIAAELRRYGLKDILIDAGWHASGGRSGGPWKPGPFFPKGMKALADRVHSEGLSIGLWMRPLDFESTRLDPSSEFTKSLLQREAAKISGTWGFDFIKIDAVDWDAFHREDRFLPEDDSSTTDQAVRSALAAMRNGLRGEAFLLGLEAAGPASLGLVEAAGIVRDVDATRWQTVRNSALKAAALRYHLNNALWANDPGYMVIGKPATLSQSRAWASLIAFSGGCVFAGDSLLSLSEKKRSIIKRIIPPYGQAARPMDLFEKESPQIWVLEIEKPFGKWHIVGLFNWDPTPKEIEESYRQAVQSNVAILRENDRNEAIERSQTVHRKIAADNRLIRRENKRIASVLERSGITQARLTPLHLVRKMRKSPRFRNLKVSLRRLGLDVSIPYLIYDFWADHFLGEHRASLTTLVKLAGCRVLAFHPSLGHPQLVSTNRHVTQGGIELKDLRWDDVACELKGKSELVAEDDYCTTLHVPRDYTFLEVSADCAEFRADARSPHLVRLWFKHPRDKTISWQAKFNKLR
jgi:hypothetical protein